MTLIRAITIENFRCIKTLTWFPTPGINCLIGPGDSGKTSIIDAIDFCMGARRSVSFSDADFFQLDFNKPIKISITLGALDDQLKNIDSYGMYLRGFDMTTGKINPEPGAGLETVLTVQLTVEGDLEPQWSLVSERAAAEGYSRNLAWAERVRLAPTRLGVSVENNLGWYRGSILNKITDERADASPILAQAGREARAVFGDQANENLKNVLDIVCRTANDLGVPVGTRVNALLDAGSISFSGGMISLHDEAGIPLKGLGLGSTRLLIAGLQRKAAEHASIILIDELEHGLEPHRIIRLLSALGSKEEIPPLQVFMTTHSPVAVRELSGNQVFVLRNSVENHDAINIGTADDVQGTVRKHPEALLAASVIVCEGASEVGLLRGLDQYRTESGKQSFLACGVALVDGGGNEVFKRALAIQSLGYRTAVLRDSDVLPTPNLEKDFINDGGDVFAWRDGRTLEDELFLSLIDEDVGKLLDHAISLKGNQLVDEHIKSASENSKILQDIQIEPVIDGLSAESRKILGKASRSNDSRKSWFKSVGAMEYAGHQIIGPGLEKADTGFSAIIENIFIWATANDREF